MSPELAQEKGIANLDWVTVSTPRGHVSAKALVTRRMRPLHMGDRMIHQIGMPWHWGYQGVVKGDVVNNLSAMVADPNSATRETVAAREREQFGGIKIGSAFFGWLAATGMSVLLTALVAAAGTAVGLATSADVNAAVNQASTNQTVGLVGVIVLLAILFVAYYCGGYVAGRMARFNGLKQGLMVWVWALIFAVLVALLAMIAGERFNILANLNSFPRIPVNEGQLTTTGIIAAVVVAVVALIGAVLGGLAGMHFHRKVDRAGFTPVEVDE
jgi:hypothetical protein